MSERREEQEVKQEVQEVKQEVVKEVQEKERKKKAPEVVASQEPQIAQGTQGLLGFYLPPEIIREAMANPDVLTEIMEVRRELRDEFTKRMYYESLAKAQAEIGKVEKNMVVYNKDHTIRYRYASFDKVLEAIKPIFKYGFSIRHESHFQDGRYIVITYLTHRDGWSEKAQFMAQLGSSFTNMSAIQEIGALESYGRRYNILKLLNIAGDEDTDANAVEGIIVKDVGRVSDPMPTPNRNVNVNPEEYKELLRAAFGLLSREFNQLTKDEHRAIWHKFLRDTYGVESSKDLKDISNVMEKLRQWIKDNKGPDKNNKETEEKELPF